MLRKPTHAIGPDVVHVWHLLSERLTDPRVLPALSSLLSAQESQRVQSLRHERDRALALLARGMTRTVLASYLDCPCADVCFTANDFGKPTLPGHAPPLRFNLTHSRGAVALAVSSRREVGIDVEERRRPADYLALAERFFAEPEWRHLSGLAPEHLPDAFFAIWTLKEAFVKGIGRGLSFPLEAFCFDLDGRRLTRFRPLAEFVSPDWHFHQFDLGDRHCGAVAVQGNGATIVMHDWLTVFV
jgi:4'-phosphopantetheinyl transferase